MGTLIGIIIGIAATILVARYYFRRSINKRISVFVTQSNRIFAGIEQEVRKQLAFHYKGKEINELQQINLIVANDGDRAIRDCIEPLTLRLKKSTTILDATVLHREPPDLQIKIAQDRDDNMPIVRCEFPLLNAGEFFMLKLLLDGYIKRSDIECHILVDDLPRSFSAKLLPRSAVTEPKRKIEWIGVIMGLSFLVVVASFSLILWNYRTLKPSIWPYPWAGFQPSWIETPALTIAAFGLMFMMLIGLVSLIGMGFEDLFSRHPRFPLPEELRGRSYRFPRQLAIQQALEELPGTQGEANGVSKDRSEQAAPPDRR
jgi:hypothetical protein